FPGRFHLSAKSGCRRICCNDAHAVDFDEHNAFSQKEFFAGDTNESKHLYQDISLSQISNIADQMIAIASLFSQLIIRQDDLPET
ncbi:MAG TPA: hypothetical protein PKJ25_10890, partial [Smithellaceae bacterium]|nr:hypothetical protein [Smithellaceae bacterium]